MPIQTFDRTYLVNLDRQRNRLESFHRRLQAAVWPFTYPWRVTAIDGQKVPAPVGYSQQPGAWGCLRSHMRLWEDAMNDGMSSVFIFEDDCVFCEDFTAKLQEFLAVVPDDWDMVYLGGLHRFVDSGQPQKVADNCYRAWGVTGTWAYAINGKFLPTIYQWFNERPLDEVNHIDQMLCRYHTRLRPNVYIPHPWLCGMAGGVSGICGRDYMHDHWWHWQPGEPGTRPPALEAVERLGSCRIVNGVQTGGVFRMGFNEKGQRP
jgi:GR25 family glycosyltransferase involved in LPS biosynthesis